MARSPLPRRGLRLLPLLVAAAAGVGAGCGVGAGDPMELPEPDRAELVESVQPFLGPRCGTRSCHGDPARTLLLHAIGYNRLRPEGAGVPLDEGALSSREIDQNYDALRFRMARAGSAEDTYLLRKVLPPDYPRRLAHFKGTVVFERDADPDFQALRHWIQGAFE